MYYGARYYLPSLRRFISADTVVPGAGNPQNLNRYTYGANNPILFNDPTGHVPNIRLTRGEESTIGAECRENPAMVAGNLGEFRLVP